MPSAARARNTNMSNFLAKEGCTRWNLKDMWTVTIDGLNVLGAHFDEVVIACANRQVLDGFRARLLGRL